LASHSKNGKADLKRVMLNFFQHPLAVKRTRQSIERVALGAPGKWVADNTTAHVNPSFPQ